MKVLMQTRQNVFDLAGGDTTQLVKTKEALESKGIDVDLSLDLRPDVSGYDVVHLFNLTRVQETFIQSKNAKEAGKPVVLSTIYWPTDSFEKSAANGLRGFLGKHLSVDGMERLKAFGKYVLRGERSEGARYLMTHSFQKMQLEILDNCDVFLPNAKTEMDQIAAHLGFRTDNYVVVPNAVDVASIKAAKEVESTGYERFSGWIVCIGRIDIRKNQLNLIKAVEGSDYKVVFVGKKSPGHIEYANKVVSEIEANPNMEWIEQIPNEDIYKLCRECRVGDGRICYPLGTIKDCDGFAMLAFTHMDEVNRAYLRRGQYEECLLNMWDELDRMYAGRRIVLPLLGSGITRFENGKPSEDDLLRCMLCTLRASKHHFKEGVNVVLTKKTAARMRLFEVNGYAEAWNNRIGEKDGL